MTPERRAQVVSFLRGLSAGFGPTGQAVLSEAAVALESAGTCGFCGREVHADLKPMCGDCAGGEDPATVALRADLAKAKEDHAGAIAAEQQRRLLAESRLAKAKERIAELEGVASLPTGSGGRSVGWGPRGAASVRTRRPRCMVGPHRRQEDRAVSALGYGDSWGEGDSPRPEDARHWQSIKASWVGPIHLAFRTCSARKAEEKTRGSTFGTGRRGDVTCPECREAIRGGA